MEKRTINRIRTFTADRDWDQFHSPANLAKSISIEANELLECFQWDEDNYDIDAVKEELADVLVYCRNMLDKLELDEDEIVNAKMDKNEAKYPVDKSKGKSDKYTKLDLFEDFNDSDVKSCTDRMHITLLCISQAMNRFAFASSATEAQKKLAKEIKEYLLAYLNSQTTNGHINDPVFGCSIKPFHAKHLAWNKREWEKSAKIVYCYFKAEALVPEIKRYEKAFHCDIITNHTALLDFLFDEITKENSVNYAIAQGVNSDFSLVPEEVLDDKLLEFKNLYE